MPFSLGPTEMIFIMVVLLLVFGAKRLPELGSGLGKGIREFRRSMNEIKHDIDRPPASDQQIQPPKPASAVSPPAESGETFNKE